VVCLFYANEINMLTCRQTLERTNDAITNGQTRE